MGSSPIIAPESSVIYAGSHFDIRYFSQIPSAPLQDCSPDLSVAIIAGDFRTSSKKYGRLLWRDENGNILIWKSDNIFEILFPEFARFFHDSGSSEISVTFSSECSTETLEHLLLDQVLPRVVSHLGKTVIHAGAMMTGSKAALFLGDTGAGKSTLVASLFGAGHKLLSDDAVVMDMRDGTPTALATYPSLRLWPTSLEAVVDPAVKVAPMAHYSTKRRLLLESPDRIETGEMPIGGIFIVDAIDSNAESSVIATRLSESEVTIELVKAGFRLDPTDPAVAARDMQRAATVAKVAPGWRLTYPRKFSVLGHVRDAIMEKMIAGNG